MSRTVSNETNLTLSASNIFTPLSQIKVSVPRSIDAIDILNFTPLMQINIKERYGKSETVIYDFDANNNTLMAGRNGEVYIGKGFLQLGKLLL